MEFDELRRQWQQPATDTALPDYEVLSVWLNQQSGSPVAQMMRNAKQEIIWTAIMLGISAAILLLVRLPLLHPLWLLLLASVAQISYDYYHKLRILRQLSHPESPLRSYLRAQLRHLRRLLRGYYRFTMATLVVMVICLFYFTYTRLPQLFQGGAQVLGPRALWLMLTLLASWFITSWITRWHLQHGYGQHLDRLEATLRELGADEAE